jgi:hypothetical protein
VVHAHAPQPLSSIRSGRGFPLNVSEVENLICAVLRGETSAWPDARDVAPIEIFLVRSDFHGVQALLHERLRASAWPSELLQRLRENAVGRAMWELRHQQVLTRTLAALAAGGVEPVLFKGTALAYSLYANPVLRARGDTDLIVAPESTAQVDAALKELGFVRDVAVSGDFVSYQACYTREEDGGETHTLDLHWRINNSEVLARLFSYEELRRQAQALPRLCSLALGASPVHALLIACMHRATHKQNPMYVQGVPHYDADRLIWLYDIHLLVGTLSQAQWDEFARLAGSKGLRAVCQEGFEHARECFHTAYPESVMTALARAGSAEPAARYLDGSRLRQQWMDFCAIAGGRNKLRFLRESVFPPETYMRHKYPNARAGWLPWLYLRRAFGGVAKKLRSS